MYDEEFKMSASYKELLGFDGEPIELSGTVSQDFRHLHILQKIQHDLRERNVEPQKFTDWIIFMSMFKRHRLDKEKETM